MISPFELYQRANTYLNEGLIRTEAPDELNPRIRREWMEWFLPRLEHPQRSFGAIHVAGTSGKGSVATMIAEILRAAGIRVGLHVTPYLQVSTEKLWVDGRYASAEQLSNLVDWIRPAAEACRGPHTPLHGMAWVGITLEHFRRSQVELSVIEAGVGGRSDLTNVLKTRVAVITALGLDHVKTLGPDLGSIAWHKAGIIKPGCRAVVLDGPGVPAAREQSRAVQVPLRVLDRASFGWTRGDRGRVFLDFVGRRFHLRGVPLAMSGAFQAENAALAVAALEELEQSSIDIPRIDEEAVVAGLSRARLPGRLEWIPPLEDNSCPVLLDGAHNPDKLTAMMKELRPTGHRRLHLIYGALGSRAPDEQLRRLASVVDTFVATEPRVYQKTPRPAEEIRQVVGPRAIVEPDGLSALGIALERAGPEDLVLVTGSLYLCGQVRERWYRAAEVVQQRRSWF